ncbi:Polygalacturonase inhibitor [Spatholobus suberectus]|nr:Polygalacturonase inhibitor [Spatholobus suberectus]
MTAIRFYKLPNPISPIQPTISKLTNLKRLVVINNNISSPIPDFGPNSRTSSWSAFSLTSLQAPFRAHFPIVGPQQAHGPNPGLIWILLPDLILSHNQLSGPIPASLANLDPARIDLSRNKLEGDACMLFGKNTTEKLDLSRNKFEFNLSHLKFPKTSLIHLDLCHNNINGSIPVALTEVENLQHFNVSYNNRLSDEISQGGKLQKFNEYSYFHTKLCGSPLPPCANKQDLNPGLGYGINYVGRRILTLCVLTVPGGD